MHSFQDFPWECVKIIAVWLRHWLPVKTYTFPLNNRRHQNFFILFCPAPGRKGVVVMLGIFVIELGFNDTSTLVGHFVSSPREREKRDRRDSRGDEREGQGRKRNKNESEETEEIKISPSTLTCYKDSRPCPTVSQYQLDVPVT